MIFMEIQKTPNSQNNLEKEEEGINNYIKITMENIIEMFQFSKKNMNIMRRGPKI